MPTAPTAYEAPPIAATSAIAEQPKPDEVEPKPQRHHYATRNPNPATFSYDLNHDRTPSPSTDAHFCSAKTTLYLADFSHVLMYKIALKIARRPEMFLGIQIMH